MERIAAGSTASIWFSTMRAISSLLLVASAVLADDALTKGLEALHAGRYAEARTYLEKSGDTQAPVFLALVQAATGGCTDAIPRLAEAFSHAADPTLRKLTGGALMSCVD